MSLRIVLYAAAALRDALLKERLLADWVCAAAVLGINYGASSRTRVTLRETPGVDSGLAYTTLDKTTISGNLLFGLVFGLPAALSLTCNALENASRRNTRGAAAVARGTRDVHLLMLCVLEAYALASCWKIWLNVAVGRQARSCCPACWLSRRPVYCAHSLLASRLVLASCER